MESGFSFSLQSAGTNPSAIEPSASPNKFGKRREKLLGANNQNRRLEDEQLDDSIADTLVSAPPLVSACR